MDNFTLTVDACLSHLLATCESLNQTGERVRTTIDHALRETGGRATEGHFSYEEVAFISEWLLESRANCQAMLEEEGGDNVMLMMRSTFSRAQITSSFPATLPEEMLGIEALIADVTKAMSTQQVFMVPRTHAGARTDRQLAAA